MLPEWQHVYDSVSAETDTERKLEREDEKGLFASHVYDSVYWSSLQKQATPLPSEVRGDAEVISGGCLFLNIRSTMRICPYPQCSRFLVSLDRIRPDTARGVDVESGLLTPRSADTNNPLRTPFRNGCVGMARAPTL
jgi:hypothetical protein